LAEGRDYFNLGGKVRGREGTGNDQRKINKITIIKIYLTKKRKRERKEQIRNSPTWYIKNNINSRY